MSNKISIARERFLYNDRVFSIRDGFAGHRGNSLTKLQSIITGLSVLACAVVFVIL